MERLLDLVEATITPLVGIVDFRLAGQATDLTDNPVGLVDPQGPHPGRDHVGLGGVRTLEQGRALNQVGSRVVERPGQRGDPIGENLPVGGQVVGQIADLAERAGVVDRLCPLLLAEAVGP